MLLSDYDMMSPAERETAIRWDYATSQRNINALVQCLADEYRTFEYLGDLIADIEVYGAEDVFCLPKNDNVKASFEYKGYVF